MADFPTFPHLIASNRTTEAGVQVDYTEGGGVRARRMFATPRLVFKLVLAPLSSSDKDALLSHYATHRDQAFNYTWPEGADPSTVIYTAYPNLRQAEAGAYWVAEITLEGS